MTIRPSESIWLKNIRKSWLQLKAEFEEQAKAHHLYPLHHLGRFC